MKRVFICSKYAGDVARNTVIAERLCRKAIAEGYAPFAAHLLYTRFLDDAIPSERTAGQACALEFMEICDEVWIFIHDGISPGMERERQHALFLGKPLVYMEIL